MKSDDERQLKRSSNGKPGVVSYDSALSAGLTQLDLATSNRIGACLLPGHIYLLVGQSQSGKSWLGRQFLAEASINSMYDDYALIYNNPERREIDIRRYYGRKLAKRIENMASETVEHFYGSVVAQLRKGPCIIVLDSENALSSKAELERIDERATAIEKGRSSKEKGSYGAEKARDNSAGLRVINNKIANTGSIIIIIQQTRHNIGRMAQFNPETKSGGLALSFFAMSEYWFKIVGKIKRTVNGIDRVIGQRLRISIKKNSVSGNDWVVDLPFYKNTGFDDIGGCIDYLVFEGRWEGSKEKVIAPDFDYRGSKEGLIRQITEGNMEQELKFLVAEVWHDLIEKCKVNRRSRYD